MPSDNYTFDSSKSVRDGKFLGLALDYDNEDDKAEQQIESWAKQLRAEMEV